MRSLDERILERLADDGTAPAWMIASDIEIPRVRVGSRCRVLAEADFITREPREGFADVWEISSMGLLYLAGELDADHRRPLPAPRPPDKVRPGWYAGFG